MVIKYGAQPSRPSFKFLLTGTTGFSNPSRFSVVLNLREGRLARRCNRTCYSFQPRARASELRESSWGRIYGVRIARAKQMYVDVFILSLQNVSFTHVFRLSRRARALPLAHQRKITDYRQIIFELSSTRTTTLALLSPFHTLLNCRGEIRVLVQQMKYFECMRIITLAVCLRNTREYPGYILLGSPLC